MSTPRSQRGDPVDSTSSHPSSSPSRGAYIQDASSSTPSGAPNPTYATFSPTTLSSTTLSAASAAKRRSTILVHQKSPLLLATPPQITRALAYSHPFLLPLNKLVGLLSWTTGDPWESFLLVVAYWTAVLYGDVLVRVAGPLTLVLLLIGGMYGRRYSPLSSSGLGEPRLGTTDGGSIGNAESTKAGKKTGKQKNLSVDATPDRGSKVNSGAGDATPGVSGQGRARSHTTGSMSTAEATSTRHQKTLDEIVETLREFTGRCNILLEPLLELTDFLSTQRTPTSATVRPALTTLFVRILLCSPVWFALTLSPWRIITSQRVLLVFGTLILTWHSNAMRVSRVNLWRSTTLRRCLALVTGLRFQEPVKKSVTNGAFKNGADTAATTGTVEHAINTGKANATGAATKGTAGQQRESELTRAIRRSRNGRDAGVRFTFIIYENQRRWVGLGWTNSLFAYERAAWTDEHNNSVPPRDQFELPEVEDGSRMRWMWVEGSRWRVDGVSDEAVAGSDEQKEWDYDGPGGRMGWVFYDNKWQNGRRGQDGWGRWTRRRKWYRDAELVEVEDDMDIAAAAAENQPSINATVEAVELPTSEPHNDGSTPAPNLPPRPNLSDRTPTTALVVSTPCSQAATSLATDEDTASMMSTSSKSARFGSMKYPTTPTLRRRATGESSRKSGRRASDAVEEEDAAALGASLGLSPRGGESNWGVGVGDELRMGLE